MFNVVYLVGANEVKKLLFSAFLTAFLIVITISGLFFVFSVHFGKAQSLTQISTGNSVTQLWMSQVEGSLVYDPTVSGGYVYTVSGWSGGTTGYLNCFDASNGNQIWNFTVLQYNRIIVVDEGYLYTGSGDGHFYALNASTGAQLWNLTGIGWTPAPAVAGGYVYFGGSNYTRFGSPVITGGFVYTVSSVLMDDSWNSALYAFNASSGDIMWNGTFIGRAGGPVVDGGYVYVSSNHFDENGNIFAGDVYAFNRSTGVKAWTFTTGGDVSSAVVGVGGVVYVGSGDKSIYALNAYNGRKLWNYTTVAEANSPVIANGNIYVNSGDSLYCLNANTGAKIWNYTTEGPTTSSPTVEDDLIYFGSVGPIAFAPFTNHTLYALDALTGKKIWSYTIEGSVGTPVVSGHVLYFCSASSTTESPSWQESGAVYALKSPVVSASPSPSEPEEPEEPAMPTEREAPIITDEESNQMEQSPVNLVVAIVIAATVVGAGLLVYFKIRKH
jgi:outer membrane protein assembly factor BamB